MTLDLDCTSRAPTSHDTCRCAGPWEHPQPAKQLSARRLSAMTPKAAKRTSKRRPARRKENQKPKSAAAKPPTKAKTKRRLQSLRRRGEARSDAEAHASRRAFVPRQIAGRPIARPLSLVLSAREFLRTRFSRRPG